MGIAVRKDDDKLLQGINDALKDFDAKMQQEYMERAISIQPAMDAE